MAAAAAAAAAMAQVIMVKDAENLENASNACGHNFEAAVLQHHVVLCGGRAFEDGHHVLAVDYIITAHAHTSCGHCRGPSAFFFQSSRSIPTANAEDLCRSEGI